LLTTAEDLLAWNDYYLNNRLGGSLLFLAQTETTPFNNGKKHNYAAGLVIDSLRGWAVISHSGATAGYRANLEHFPQQGLSIAWLSNNAQPDLGDIPSAIRNVFVKNLLVQNNTASTPTANVHLSNFIPYTGSYTEEKTGNGVKILIKDTVLMSETMGRLTPQSANTASIGRWKIVFFKSPKHLIIVNPSGDTLNYTGADSARVALSDLNEYAGMYSSEETESKMSIIIKDGKLFARQRGENAPLTPMYKDGFSFPGGDLFFERDKKGKINKMFISISRARKVEFNKVR
jgi:hypothetical protein